MGGVPPLGYDVRERRLVPNLAEAQLIQHIFCRFIALGSSTLLVKELQQMGATSKSWSTQSGQVRQGKPIDKSLIYKLLNNRLYLGELRHQSEWYFGEHTALIDQTTWDNVQAILAVNRRFVAIILEPRFPFYLKGCCLIPMGVHFHPGKP
ncbi:MAG: recombinase family protein [Candidatus Symbiodolus clandestinus]